MGDISVNECFAILNEKPGLFRKEDVARKLQCFDTMQEAGAPGMIHWLLPFLKSNNALIQAKASETVLHLFAQLRSLNEYTDALKQMPVAQKDLDLYRTVFDEGTYVQLLAIASLNADGYLREKAVRELARLRNPTGIKFILLRLGDWVDAVREAANEAIAVYLEETYIAELLCQLPVIDWLLNVKRIDLTETHDRIIRFITHRELDEGFYNQLKRLDDKVRFRFYKRFLADRHPSKEQVDKMMADGNFLVRLELLKHLQDFDAGFQKVLIDTFLHDRSIAMRQAALYASKAFSPEFDPQIMVLTSDESAPVRELSRYLFKGKGIGFAQLYRQRIAEKQLLTGSLLGLSETGSEEDLPLFEQYIHKENGRLVPAALVGMNKFNPTKAKAYARELLIHKSKRVRHKVIDILARNSDPETIKEARRIYTGADQEIKKTLLNLFNRMGGWGIVGDLLIALSDENMAIQDSAWQMLAKWKLRATNLFITPPAADMERANKIYDALDLDKLNTTPARTKLLQDVKFYLQ